MRQFPISFLFVVILSITKELAVQLQNFLLSRDIATTFTVLLRTPNVSFGFFFAISAFCVVIAEEPTPVKPTPPTVHVEIERKGQFDFSALAKIDAVNVGQDNSVLLRLRNNTGSKVTFGEPSTTCGCVKVVSQCSQLLDGSECDLQIQLRPDRNYKEQVWQQTVSFAPTEKGASLVTVTIHAALKGVFVAEPSRLLFVALDDIRPVSKHLRKTVTVDVTPPVKLGNLKIVGGPLLEFFEVTVSPVPGSKLQAIVSLEIDADSIPEEGLHESLTLTDSESGQSRLILVSASRRNSIRVVPVTMMVQKLDAEDSWAAYGMIINQSEVTEGGDAASPPVLDVMIAGVKIPTTVLAGGSRIQRFRLDFSQDLTEKLFAENPIATCVFDVHWGPKRTSCTCELSFGVRPPLSGEK